MGLVEALQNKDKKQSTGIERHFLEMEKGDCHVTLVSGSNYYTVNVGHHHTQLSMSNNTYINSERSFFSKYQPLAEYYLEQGLTAAFVRDKFNFCLSSVLALGIQLKAFELTKDLSVIFTLLANGKKVYFEYYFDYNVYDLEDDEVIFTLEVSDGQMKSFGGTLESSIRNLQHAITFSNATVIY